VEVILFNHLLPERWKEQTEQWTEHWKEQTEQWKGFYFLLNGKPRIYNLRIIAVSFVENL
jgi:hypothetical protein